MSELDKYLFTLTDFREVTLVKIKFYIWLTILKRITPQRRVNGKTIVLITDCFNATVHQISEVYFWEAIIRSDLNIVHNVLGFDRFKYIISSSSMSQMTDISAESEGRYVIIVLINSGLNCDSRVRPMGQILQTYAMDLPE